MMKKGNSAFTGLIKLKSKTPVLYVIVVIIVFLIAVQIDSYYHGYKKDRQFYASEIDGVIDDIRKDFKGSLVIEINNTWYNLSIYGACIKKISVGDKIQKDANSFTIIIIPKGTGEIIEYKCYTNKKFENKLRSPGK